MTWPLPSPKPRRMTPVTPSVCMRTYKAGSAGRPWPRGTFPRVLMQLSPAFSRECAGQGTGAHLELYSKEERGTDMQVAYPGALEGGSEGGVPATGCEWTVSLQARFMGCCECEAVTTVAGKACHGTHRPSPFAGRHSVIRGGGKRVPHRARGSGGWRPGCRPCLTLRCYSPVLPSLAGLKPTMKVEEGTGWAIQEWTG